MSEVLTNDMTLALAVESSVGVAGTTWRQLLPTSIGRAGASLTDAEQQVISANQQREAGAVVDLDSGVDIELPLTMETLYHTIEAALWATKTGPARFVVTAVTSTGYTVASGGAVPDGTIFVAKGFANPENNGVKVAAGTSTGTEIKTTGLVAEAAIPATQNATVEVCGFETAVGDLDVDANGNLTSTSFDFTASDWDLQRGQFVWVGGELDDTSSIFTTAANRGLARIALDPAANLLTLDKKGSTFVAEANTTKAVWLLFGPFVRNVARDHADYLVRSYSAELAYPTLGGPSTPAYKYPEGNHINEYSINLEIASLATMAIAMVGTDTPAHTESRASGASSAIEPVQTAAFNCASDFARLRLTATDETSYSTYFTSLSLNINNQVSPRKALANLGAVGINRGNVLVDVDATLMFTDADLAAAVRDYETVTMEVALRNPDGGFVIDVPAMKITGGDEEFTPNEEVRISGTCKAHRDTSLGYSVSFSLFPYLPSA